jgi:hypothetical protein
VVREKDLERYLVRRVASLGGVCWKWVSPSHAGVPDRIVVLPLGRVAFVEVKRPGQRPTALQQQVMGVLSALGCRVGWVDSQEAVDAFLS